MKASWLLSILCFVCAANVAVAQSDFKPGYIIKSPGDTIRGIIDYRGNALMSTRCRIIVNGQTSYTDYSPAEIYGYRFDNGKFYISKNVDGSSYFLEYLVKGLVSFYYLKMNNTDTYYVENDSLGIQKIPYQEGTRTENNNEFSYKSTIHIGLLKCYMQNAPSITKYIEKIDTPNSKNLISLDEKYHELICEGDKCVVYKKKASPSIIILEPHFGYVKYNYEQSSRFNSSSSNIGIMANFWLPLTSEKLYFRVGISHIQLNAKSEYINELQEKGEETTKEWYKIPLQVEYIYPKGKIRPKAAIGLTVYNWMSDMYLSGMIGADMKIFKKFGISVYSDFDFEGSANFQLYPKRWLSVTANVGILYYL